MIKLIRKENMPKTLRRLVYALLLLIFAALQSTGCFPAIGGINFLPLLPLTVCIAMFERETFGMELGLLAGVLWDINSASGDGFHALTLAFTGFICGLLMTYLMQNNLLTAFILTLFFTLFHNFLYWLFFVAAKGFDSAAFLLWRYYLPSALLCTVLMPVFYYPVRAIMKRSRLTE